MRATEQQLKPQCVINFILALNPKHSARTATREKINSIQAETRKHSFRNLGLKT